MKKRRPNRNAIYWADICLSILGGCLTRKKFSLFSFGVLLILLWCRLCWNKLVPLAQITPCCSACPAAKSLIVQSQSAIMPMRFPLSHWMCVRALRDARPLASLFACCCVRLLLSLPQPPSASSPAQPCLTGYHGINPRLRLSEYIFMCLHFIIYIRCNPVFHLALCCLARGSGARNGGRR